MGFDNTDNAIMTTPTLTTVNQPRYRMGYTACNILLERMKGAADEGGCRAAVNDHDNRACGARIHHALEGITKSASG